MIQLQSPTFRTWIVRVVSGIVFLNGLFALDRPLAERIPERLEALLVPFSFDYTGRLLDLLLGITLMYLSYQLWQRKIVAWWLGLGAGAALAMLHWLTSHDPLTLVLPLASVAALLITKDYFRSRSEYSKVRLGVVIFGASILLALAYGTIGFWLMDRRDFGVEFSFMDAIYRSLREYTLIGNPDLRPHSHFADWFLGSLGFLGAGSILFGLYSLFRPLAYVYQELPAERRQVQTLLEHSGHASDDFFKLWPHDKSYYFAPGEAGAVAYGVAAGVAMAVGDPIAPDSSKVAQTVRGFDEMSRDNGWEPSFMYVTGAFREAYKAAGYELLQVGEDAVIDLNRFAQDTAFNKHFRNIRNRFEKEGYTVEVSQPPHDPKVLRQTAVVSADWGRQPDRREWKFLAGSYGRSYMQMGPLFIVRDSTGKVQAFANQVPTYLDGWATIDLMRYRQRAPKGIMDYLLMMTLLMLSDQGYRKFNLGLAPLSGLAEANRPEEKLLNLIYRSNQKFVSLQGLRQFKGKFEPDWEPKYMAYRGGVSKLPRMVYALNMLMKAK